MASTGPDTPARKVRFCSAVSAASGEDTAGSAWHTPRYLMVEFPLPWTYNMFESPNAPDGLQALAWEMYEAGIASGMVGFAPDEEWSVPGMSRIFDHRIEDGPIRGYMRDEYLVPSAELVSLLRAHMLHPDIRSLEPYLVTANPARNLFVCTHGAIDACCATFGYPVYKLLRSMTANPSFPFRTWRCTHFGGHRFAATFLEMPEGRYWGHLDARDLRPLITREVSFGKLRHRYRGWAAVENAIQQVAEAEILCAVGWSWTEYLVGFGTYPPNPPYDAVDADPGPWTFRFMYHHPASTETGTISVDVETAGSIRTLHTSTSGEYTDEMQYRAEITSVDSEGGPIAETTSVDSEGGPIAETLGRVVAAR